MRSIKSYKKRLPRWKRLSLFNGMLLKIKQLVESCFQVVIINRRRKTKIFLCIWERNKEALVAVQMDRKNSRSLRHLLEWGKVNQDCKFWIRGGRSIKRIMRRKWQWHWGNLNRRLSSYIKICWELGRVKTEYKPWK